jgi:hypothetical protein
MLRKSISFYTMTVAVPPAIVLGVHLGYNAYGT